MMLLIFVLHSIRTGASKGPLGSSAHESNLSNDLQRRVYERHVIVVGENRRCNPTLGLGINFIFQK